MTKTIAATIAIMMVLGVSTLTGARAAQGVVASNGNDTDPTALAKNFVTPPDSARIWVYWFWLNGNITRGGITADLEAMKRAGVGGVLIMEVDQGSPVGPVAFMSERWRELFKHVVAEAHRLGLEVNMNNDAGWNGSGGPWVPLDQAMQVVVTSETQVRGGKKFEGELPNPAPMRFIMTGTCMKRFIATSPCWRFPHRLIRRMLPIA